MAKQAKPKEELSTNEQYRVKKTVGCRMYEEVIDELQAAKNAVPNLTIQEVIDEGVEIVLARLRAQFHGGKPFSPRTDDSRNVKAGPKA